MEETLEGGRGPPQAVEPLEREREHIHHCYTWHQYFHFFTCSRLSSFTWYHITVLHTSWRVTVITLTQHSICPMLIHSRACTGARSNTQEAAFAHLSHSAATYILCNAQCTSTVIFTIFFLFFNCCQYVFVMNGMGDENFDEHENKHGCGWMPLCHNQNNSFLLQEKQRQDKGKQWGQQLTESKNLSS